MNLDEAALSSSGAKATSVPGSTLGGMTSLFGSGGGTNTSTGIVAGSTGVGTTCGNSVIDETENCDDGNNVSGDGCDGTCKVENGYECKTPGTACTSTLFCGDGLPGPDESCDDKNKISGDGCSSLCAVEPGYLCPQFGAACIPSNGAQPVCGNAGTETGETCDDGNTTSGDGCSATCQTEAGFTCNGAVCTKNATCGNGVLNSDEQCDDGNLTPSDCCSASCKLETNCKCNNPPLGSTHVGQLCESTVVCGDGVVSGSEVCDDGNRVGTDGCSMDCRTIESGYDCPTGGGACSVATVLCPNSTIDPGEGCDDGNSVSSDGCATNCKLESGYVCPAPGSACVLKEICGNGNTSYLLGETCDDGNLTGGDGCSAKCLVEAGYSCNTAASPSVCMAEFCGNGRITTGEVCDDGNKAAGDGCSVTCTVEPGFRCPKVGAPCRPICGDGAKTAAEQCDDHNAKDGDGCNSACRVEPGYDCPTVGQACVASVCGNNDEEAGEGCDDGNKVAGDGCGPTCQKEPLITPGTNPTVTLYCGDGLITGTEQCDDGNKTSRDGCSEACKVEAGYHCDPQLQLPTTVKFKVTHRDFKSQDLVGGHPDFENVNSSKLGIVGEACKVANATTCGRLDADGKPVLKLLNQQASTGVKNQDTFSLWYRNANPNHIKDDNSYSTRTDIAIAVVESTLTLTQLETGSLDYQFSSGSFFPLTGIAFGNEDFDKNFGFTTELRYFFQYQGGETLTFSGDDDVWVFINGRLAVDIGGVHGVKHGRVLLGDDGTPTGTDSNCSVHLSNTLPTLGTCYDAAETADNTDARFGLTKGGVYEIVLFHAERHTSASNFKLTLSGFLAPRSYCSPTCGDGIVAASEECDLGIANSDTAYNGCTKACKYGPYCGDGTKTSPAEACDKGSNNVDVYGIAPNGCTPDCQLTPYCGDGKTDLGFGETCDLGSANTANAYGPNQCTDKCALASHCGDGVQDASEACDDGQNNGSPISNCDVSCKLKCGNGTLEAGEQCDAGTAKNTGAYGGCTSTCTWAPFCGDGVKDAAYGEACDDGRNDGSYGTCTSSCQLAAHCGDGTVNAAAGERCDLGAANQVNPYGAGLCTTTCQPAPYCGDHAVNTAQGESCDDGSDNSNVVLGACKLDCSGYIPPPSTCGNGVLDAGEVCDNGALNGTAGNACDGRCQYKCGNGIKDSGEQCDDGVNDGSYGTCNHDCTLPAFCGDGIRNGLEQCDLGTSNTPDPSAYGQDYCTTSCTRAPYCGDGRVNHANEICDGQPGCTANCVYEVIL